MSTVTIPSRVVPRVREGAYSALRDCAEAIDQAGHDPGAHEQARVRLQGVWRLLDVIGWTSPDDRPVVDVQVDPGEHGQALLAALEPMLAVLEGWLTDMPARDPRRSARQCEIDGVRDLVGQVRRQLGGRR